MLYNVDGLGDGKMENNEFMNTFVDYDIIAIIEPKVAAMTYVFPGFAEVVHSPRIQDDSPVRFGGATLIFSPRVVPFRHPAFDFPVTGAPPETVAVVLQGALFGISAPVLLVASYCPPPGKSWSEREAAGCPWTALRDFVLPFRAAGCAILWVGDFNARVGTLLGSVVSPVQPSAEDQAPEAGFNDLPPQSHVVDLRRLDGLCRPTVPVDLDTRGRALMRACDSLGCVVLNGLEGSDIAVSSPLCTHAITRQREDGSSSQHSSLIDLVIVSPCLLDSFAGLSVGESRPHFSGHIPVTVAFRGAAQQVAADRVPTADIPSPGYLGWRFVGAPSDEEWEVVSSVLRASPDLGALESDLRATVALLDSVHVSSRDSVALLERELQPERFVQRLHEIIRWSWSLWGGRVRRVGSGPRRKRAASSRPPAPAPWQGSYFDDECRAARRVLDRARRAAGPRSSPEVRLARAAYSRLLRQKKRAASRRVSGWWEVSFVRHPAEAWAELFRRIGGGKSTQLECSLPASEQAAHFARGGRGVGATPLRLERAQVMLGAVDACVPSVGRSLVRGDVDFTPAEIEELAPTFRQRASAGLDGIRDDYLRRVLAILSPVLALLFTVLLRLSLAIFDWEFARVRACGKKGCVVDRMDTFRGLNVLSRLGRLYSKCLDRRIRSVVPAFTAFQRAFLPGRSTTDACMLLHVAISATLRRGGQLWVAFLDIRKAYPSVCREYLWAKMLLLGVPRRLVAAVRAIYAVARSAVSASDGWSEPYLSTGLREGCVLAPLLWLIYVSDLVDFLLSDIPDDIRGELFRLSGASGPLYEWLAVLLFADDLALIGLSRRALQWLLSRVTAYCAEVGLTVNTDPEKVNGSCVVLFRRRDEERLFRRGDQLRQKTGGRGRPSNVDLFLGGARLPARGAFRYLGGQTGEFGDLECMVSDRERKAVIAGQMLGGAAWSAPSLPYRNWSLAFRSLVGSVYAYLAEVWCSVPTVADIGRSPQVACMRTYLAARKSTSPWLLFQVSGQFPWWVDTGLRALRYLCRLLSSPGLLGCVVCTALGHALPLAERWLALLRVAWAAARFEVSVDGSVSLVGVPQGWIQEWPRRAREFARAALAEQVAALRARGGIFSFAWFASGLVAQDRACLDLSPLLCVASSLRARRTLARFFFGLSSVARVHANYRWRAALDAWGFDRASEHHKRACPYCLRRGIVRMDTEPHAVFECVASEAQREAARAEWQQAGLEWPAGHTLSDFVALLCTALRDRRRPSRPQSILVRLIVEVVEARLQAQADIVRRWGSRVAPQRRRDEEPSDSEGGTQTDTSAGTSSSGSSGLSSSSSGSAGSESSGSDSSGSGSSGSGTSGSGPSGSGSSDSGSAGSGSSGSGTSGSESSGSGSSGSGSGSASAGASPAAPPPQRRVAAARAASA